MRIIWCCLLIGILVSEDVLAQRSDSPSHRLIPRKHGAAAPNFNDFKSDELKELLDEYSQARREQLNRRRQTQRVTEETTPTPSQADDSLLLEPRIREFVERMEQKANDSAAVDMAEEITTFNDTMSRRLDRPLSDSLKPESIPLETKPNIIKDFGDMIRRQQRKARSQYQQAMQAMQAYEKVWPADGIPPDEWLKKVQPYINPELVRQLREYRDTQKQDSTNIKSSSSVNPKLATKNTPSLLASDPQEKSKGAFDALISAMDKKGTGWLKSSKKKNSNRDKTSSWWAALKSKTKGRVSSLNKQVTQHSRNVNRKKAATSPPGVTTASSNRDSPVNAAGKLILSFAALLVIGYFFLRKSFADSDSAEASIAHVSTGSIRDRESLLRACNLLAWRYFGWPSRFWNHHMLFSKLSELADDEAVTVQLSGLYERARYARNGDLSSQEVELAQRLLTQIRSQSLVTR